MFMNKCLFELGFTVDKGAQLLPVVTEPNKMIVYGDSIAEGGGNVPGDRSNTGVGTLDFLLLADSFHSWTFALAGALRAELGMLAWGGTGMVVLNEYNNSSIRLFSQ